MTTLITSHDISLETADGALFRSLSLVLSSGDRIGLIGHNGSGKSSLLALLSGRRAATSGRIERARHCRICEVEQHLPASLAGASPHDVLCAVLPDGQAWQAAAMLDTLGLSGVATPAGDLSGGQQNRLLLGRALLQQPDVLLLDEPGNHLDLPALLWLERFLQAWRGTFVLVSHDARLLDRVTTATWVLRDRMLSRFDVPCSAARQLLAEADEAAERRNAAEQKEIDRITASSRRLAVWGKVYDNEALSRKARVMARRAGVLRETQTVVSDGHPWTLTLAGEALPGRVLLQLDHVAVSAVPGAPVLFATGLLQLRAGDRVAVLGANGCGKSSLVRQCHALLAEPDAAPPGWRVHPAARTGYYDQNLARLAPDAGLADALEAVAQVPAATCRQALIRAGFPYARHGQQVGTLSGGERARLLFLALSLGRHHVLLLDEPTNHLDMEGKAALAGALAGFEGGCLLVSHDRALVEAACNRFWVVQDGLLREHLDAQRAFDCLQQAVPVMPAGPAPQEVAAMPADEMALLDELCALEALLAADLARRPRQQKPERQAAWRARIRSLSAQLGL